MTEESKKPVCLIMPDIHGRAFWKGALEKYSKEKYKNLNIIFLGDYLDPYGSLDGITNGEAYDNFLEIIEAAKNDSRITLLLGNHDWHYLHEIDRCRMDMARSRQIEKTLKENMELFSIAKLLEVNGIKYLFTHAGVLNGWLRDIKNMATSYLERGIEIEERNELALKIADFDIDNDDIVEFLNSFNVDDEFLSFPLSLISRERGGRYNYGSPIWADVHEHLYTFEPLKQYYQVFGHTINYPNGSVYDYYVGESIAMLDASAAFILDEEGKITKI